MKTYSAGLFLSVSFFGSNALAQVPAAVSSGATEVASEGKEKAVVPEGEIADATELALQGGGLLAGGNARSFALTASTKFLLRRGKHEFNANAAMNYAESVPPRDPTASPEAPRADSGTTVENYQGRLRYDYFFDTRVSGFMAVSARRDRFQGLDLRMGFDPGVSVYAIRDAEMKVWGELGYNLQLDLFNAQAQAARATLVPAPEPLDSRTDHNIRAFIGYQHRLDDRLSLDLGVEGFKSVLSSTAYRFNLGAQLTTQLFERFSFAVGAISLYNNDPGVPGVEKLDVQSSLSFVYTLL